MLQALGQPLRADLVLNLTRTALIAVFVLAAWWWGQAEPEVALALTALAALVVWVVADRAARRAMNAAPDAPPEEDERPVWIAAGMTFVLAMAAVSLIERLDTIMLGTLVGAEAAGDLLRRLAPGADGRAGDNLGACPAGAFPGAGGGGAGS